MHHREVGDYWMRLFARVTLMLPDSLFWYGLALKATMTAAIVVVASVAAERSGPFVAALEYASEKRAVVVGKPEESFFRIALEDMGLEASEVAMVGDDAEVDVAGAKKAGLSGIQVRTGKWRPGGDVGDARHAPDQFRVCQHALWCRGVLANDDGWNCAEWHPAAIVAARHLGTTSHRAGPQQCHFLAEILRVTEVAD